jgi:hypothetical protein
MVGARVEAKAKADGPVEERLQRSWRIEFFGILRCAQDDGGGFLADPLLRLAQDDSRTFLLMLCFGELRFF